jgi:hypothetical protein
MLGRWGFCFEEAGFEGLKATTLSGLSVETETISFFMFPGTSRFIYLKDRQGIETFEPGRPETVRGEGPYKFWTESEKIICRESQATPVHPCHAVLQVITKHIREPLDRNTLDGPLLTSFLADADRAPMNAEFDRAATSPQAPPTQEVNDPASSFRAGSHPGRTGRPYAATRESSSVWLSAARPVRYDPAYSRFSRDV